MEDSSITLTFKDNLQGQLQQNVIKFTNEQIEQIEKAAKQKTQVEWRKTASGEKVQLTEEQKKELLQYKNEFFNGVDATEAINEGDVIFKIHATQRVDERFGEVIDLQNQLDKNTRERSTEVVQLLIDSREVGDTCEWKGYETVTFNFSEVQFVINETKNTIEKVTIVVTLDTFETAIITAFRKTLLIEKDRQNKKNRRKK